MPDYLPSGEGAFLARLENLAAKLPQYQTLFDLTAAEVAAVQADLEMYRYLTRALGTLRPDVQEFTAYRQRIRNGPLGAASGAAPTVAPIGEPPPVVPSGIEPRIRSLVQRIKNHPAYTPAVGQDLQIVAPPPPVHDETASPPFKLAARPGSEVRIDWTKGSFTGVRVESRRAEETTWAFLGIDLESPYEDRRPPLVPGQPEQRHYRLRYLQGDRLVGNYSAVRSVTTVP